MLDPAPATRAHRLTLLAIMLLAASLRLWTIGDGLPYTVGVDEPALMQRSVAIMKSGDPNPHFWDYPGFTIYLHSAVASARFLSGAMQREWVSLEQVWAGHFYLWARIVTALIGTLSVYLVYRVGLRWGAQVALVTALAMAIQPQHVRESHFALTDTPLTFFVALALLLSIRAAETPTLRSFLAAGLAAGLAAATKYNGALTLLMPLAVALIVRPSTTGVASRSASVGAAVAGAALGFLCAAPYSLLDFPGFLNGFAGLMQHYNQSRPFTETADMYRKYFRDWFGWPGVLPRWIAWPALLTTVVGIGVALLDVRTPHRRAIAAAFLIFPAMYFWLIASQSLVYGRYAMPLVPGISIALALGLVFVHGRLTRGLARPRARRLVMAALLLLVVPPLATVIASNRERARVGTTELAAQWMVSAIRPNEKTAIESSLITLPPNFQLETKLRLVTTPMAQYRTNGTVYLIAVSIEYDKFFNDPVRFVQEVTAYHEIFRSTELVQTFTPSADHPGPTFRVMKVVR